jgi:beta-mannosidase
LTRTDSLRAMLKEDLRLTERISLAGEWQLAGFQGEDWRLQQETEGHTWLRGLVPGSIHWDLLKLGKIPDPYFEQNSRLVEWVRERQWVYQRDITLPAQAEGRRVVLVCDGVDGEAEFYLDGELLGKHNAAMVPVRFELTGKVHPGQSHRLAVSIVDAPRAWPRDAATRLANLGIWQDVYLEVTGPVRLEDVWVRTQLSESKSQAVITVICGVDGPAALVEVDLTDPGGRIVARGNARGSGDVTVRLEVADPALWWPNGQGAQPLYTCWVQAGNGSASREVRFGIRRLEVGQNPWPPAGTVSFGNRPYPYTFIINGQRIFVKGWNWVPVDSMYGRPDLGERYRELIRFAQEAGVNLLRVWGGGLLERALFYELCDRAGIMVWQEFMQSASGSDSIPPDDDDYVDRLEREAEQIIPLRRNHPSLAVWCGGNELTDGRQNPATTYQLALAVLELKVQALDPDRPFYAASPAGDSLGLPDVDDPDERWRFHDVHGPCHYRGPVDSYRPYNVSTALFHSAFGAEGAAARSSLNRFIPAEDQWPPDATNPNWAHHGASRTQPEWVRALFGENVETMDEYLSLSQFLQAESVRYGVESNRRRWPQCSGAIIWQLNESWPNACSTATIDYYLRPKLAYYYAKRAYAPVACSLRYAGPIIREDTLKVTPFVVSDGPFVGSLSLRVTDLTGKEWFQQELRVECRAVAEFPVQSWALPAEAPEVLIVTLDLWEATGPHVMRNPYLFSRAGGPYFPSPQELVEVQLNARQEGNRLILRNEGGIYALFPTVDVDDPRYYCHLSDNGPLLAPGEETAITITLTARTERADTDFPQGRPGPEGTVRVRVQGWNTEPVALDWEV